MLPYNVCCPECRSELQETGSSIICSKCDMHYRIEAGIPVLMNNNWYEKDRIFQDRPHEQQFFKNYVLQDEAKSKGEIEKVCEADYFSLSVPDTLDALGLKKGGNNIRILDAGCGYGTYSSELRARGYNVVGCDLSIESLKIHLSFYPEAINSLICCDLLSLPFENESFDLVFCAGVLHHFKNPFKAISELRRVSKGKIIAREPNGSNFVNKLGRLVGKTLLRNRQTGTHNETVHSLDTYRKILKKAGFASVEIVPIFPLKKKVYVEALQYYYPDILMKYLIIIRNGLLIASWNVLPAKYGGSLLLLKATHE